MLKISGIGLNWHFSKIILVLKRAVNIKSKLFGNLDLNMRKNPLAFAKFELVEFYNLGYIKFMKMKIVIRISLKIDRFINRQK